jgi:hypothetical protein
MKCNEVIMEVKSGSIPDSYKQANTGLHTFGDGEHVSGDYAHYRLGLALASTDGKSPLVDMDPKSFYGKRHTAHPYTQEEVEMLKQAYKHVGADFSDLNAGDLSSKELPDTNTKSLAIAAGPIQLKR